MEKTYGFTLALLLSACSTDGAGTIEPLAGLHQAVGSADAWVGTWAVAPQGDGSTFADKTLRQIVRTSLGGSSVRIRLSNVFGTQALLVDDVHIAERASGAAIAKGTDRVLLFGGKPSVSIAAGQAATSDATPFEVQPLSDLAVSFHLAQTSGTATAHGTGLQDNYIANGSVAAQESLVGAQVKGSYYFLTNVDVQNTAAWGAVVTLGASITDGVASGANQNRRWPDDLSRRLNAAKIPVGVLNQGISGNRLLADGAGASALKRFDRDVLSQAGVRWVIFSDDPINDLGAGNPPGGDELLAGLEQLIGRAHEAGVEFWCSTLTPFEGSGGWKPAGETARAALHAFIRGADSGCDAIVDQDTATHDPAKPTRFLPSYDAGDHLHPNERGLQAIADAVELGGFTAPADVGGAAGAAAAGGAGTAGAGAAGAAQLGGSSNHDLAGAGGGGNAATAGSAVLEAGSPPTTDTAGQASVQPATSPRADAGCGCRVAPGSRSPLGLGLLGLVLSLRMLRMRGRPVPHQ